MTNPKITAHNESTAISNIRREYAAGNVVEAIRLCCTYMGLNLQDGYQRVMEICEGVKP